MSGEREPVRLPVASEITEELPGLVPWGLVVEAGWRPNDVRGRLRSHADRLDGPRTLALRAAPTPSAYRSLFRQLGIEPDEDLPPLDRLLLHRMRRGGFPRRDALGDVLDLAVLETSVPVWGLDAAVCPGLALRLAGPGEDLGPAPIALPGPAPVGLDVLRAGHVVLADDAGPVQAIFGPGAARARPAAQAPLLLLAVAAPGVSNLALEEALWTCQEALVGD